MSDAAALEPARYPVTPCDWAHSHFVGRSDDLLAQGLQPLSLSVYGEPEDARFAGVSDGAGLAAAMEAHARVQARLLRCERQRRDPSQQAAQHHRVRIAPIAPQLR